MPYNIAQAYYLDGYSLYNYFGVGVESGSDALLQFPDRKDSTSHDWQDENGIDIDLTRVFLQQREADFKMWITALSEPDLWDKYNKFWSYLVKPGLRRLTISELSRDYYVYYKKMSGFGRFTRIKESNLIACKFTLTLVEKDPTTNSVETYIVTEQTQFLIV